VKRPNILSIFYLYFIFFSTEMYLISDLEPAKLLLKDIYQCESQVL